MKFSKSYSIFLFILIANNACKNRSEEFSNNQLPDIILNCELVEKYKKAKWEVYKYNMSDSLIIPKTSKKISFLSCDLGSLPTTVDTATVIVNNDTLKTIILYPSFHGQIVNFIPETKNVIYGVSFKGDSIKYFPSGDKGYKEVNDSINKIRELKLINFIEKDTNKVNKWLVDYLYKRL